jgi:hypothetical protein
MKILSLAFAPLQILTSIKITNAFPAHILETGIPTLATVSIVRQASFLIRLLTLACALMTLPSSILTINVLAAWPQTNGTPDS